MSWIATGFAVTVAGKATRPIRIIVAVALRILDDGAWLSVDDSRRIGVGELWRVPGFCDCALADLVIEGFTDVSVDGRTVEIRAYGTCIACSEDGSTDWLPVGRIVGTDDEQSDDSPADQSREFGPLARTDDTPLRLRDHTTATSGPHER